MYSKVHNALINKTTLLAEKSGINLFIKKICEINVIFFSFQFTPRFSLSVICLGKKTNAQQQSCLKALLSHLQKILDNGEVWLQKK